MGELLHFPFDSSGMEALETVREYFDGGPKEAEGGRIQSDLHPGDRFVAWLWMRGFKVVPLDDSER